MSLLHERNSGSPAEGLDAETSQRVFLGSYMPLVGVKIYALFDESDISMRSHAAGPIGWRASRPHTRSVKTRVDELELALA